jgi:hypothetical protein
VTDLLKPPAQVSICIPSGRQWEADMAFAMSAAVSRATAQGVRTMTINEKNSVISFARNSLVENSLRNGATHLFWCDADNVPPIGVIKRLLDHDKDIVGGIYGKRIPPYELLGIPFAPIDFSKGGLEKFWLMPGGCMMISAKVYRTIPSPWYFDSIRRDGFPIEAFLSTIDDHFRLKMPESLVKTLKENDALLQWLRQEDEESKSKFGGNKNMGEDYNFCAKAQKYGFEVWCDIDLSFELGHIGEQTVFLSRPETPEEIVA